jgi:hypothetical protein
MVESLEFVLCLDSLAGSGADSQGMYLHVHKLPKKAEIVQLYQNFETTASHMGIAYEMVHTPINASATGGAYAWPHELFARRKILSATLSTSKTSQVDLTAGSLLFSWFRNPFIS